MVAPEFPQEILQRVDILAAAELERIVVETDVAHAVFALAPIGVGRTDPEARLAVGPANRVLVFVGDLEAQECEQPAVELLGPS